MIVYFTISCLKSVKIEISTWFKLHFEAYSSPQVTEVWTFQRKKLSTTIYLYIKSLNHQSFLFFPSNFKSTIIFPKIWKFNLKIINNCEKSQLRAYSHISKPPFTILYRISQHQVAFNDSPRLSCLLITRESSTRRTREREAYEHSNVSRDRERSLTE